MTAAPGRFWNPFVRACLFGCAALVIGALPSHVHPTPFNNYVVLASAFLHGHIWIAWPNRHIDAVFFNAHHYVVNDPVPSLLLLPYVAWRGLAANQTVLSVVLGAVAAAAAWRIAENLGVPPVRALVVCAFLYAGTDLWWTAVFGDVWFLAQTSAVAFTLLALMELSGPRPKAWLAGVYCVLAIGSRFTLAMALPALAYFVYIGNVDAYSRQFAGGRRRLASFAAVIAAYACVWMWYNHARWGVLWDAGHTIFYHEDMTVGALTGSPFGLANLRMQVLSFFVTPPRIVGHWPYVIPSYRGTALTWTSPALIFAIWAREPWQTVRALWIAAICVAIPSFLYYVNGYTQFGMRHALDFEPFLFVLMLLAAREWLPKWVTALTLYSIAATSFGIWIWVTYILPRR